MGRAIRVDGDVRPIIADHVGNLWRHGTVEMEREWTLEGVSRKKREKELLEAVAQCAKCFTFYEKRGNDCCPECGHTQVPQSRELKAKTGGLKEATPEEIAEIAAMRARKREQGQSQSFDELVKIGKSRGVKNAEGWANHVIKAREEKLAKSLSGKS